MKRKIILALATVCVAACALGVSACKDNSNPQDGTGGVETMPALAFTDKAVDLLLGETHQLIPIDLLAGETVVYSTNDESVATVTEEGLIAGTGIGTAVVKAISSEGRSGLLLVTVYDPESYPVPYVALEKNAVSLFEGDKYVVSYTHTYLGESVEGTVEMTSDNTAVATVENGVVCAVGEGMANIAVTVRSVHGEATKMLTVTVLAAQTQFYPSFLGKDIYVGNLLELAVYVNENGQVETIENAAFAVENTQLATIENGMLVPLLGGDTTITATFEYGGVDYEKALPIHIYGPHTCTFTVWDGTEDHCVQATFGDVVTLELENAKNNPEYDKRIKRWYVDGKAVDDGYFVMPDHDVEITTRFVNETEDDFVSSFVGGYLLNNIAAQVEYTKGTLIDGKGKANDLDGYVRFFTNSYGSAIYRFEEAVIVNEYASIRLRLYVTNDSPLLYFGVPSEVLWPSNQSSPEYAAKKAEKRYEVSSKGNFTGDVPSVKVPEAEWVVVDLPLSAFAAVGEKLDGIAISAASIAVGGKYDHGGELLIDSISVNYGLFATDVGYQDTYYYDLVMDAEKGSAAQLDAIGEYLRWSITLTEEQRQAELHLEHVAALKALVNELSQDGKVTARMVNVLKVAGANYKGSQEVVSWNNVHTKYKTAYENFYMTQFPSAPFDGTFTLGAVSFNRFTEVSFGLYAISGNNGKITIGNQSFSFDNSKEHYFKVTVKDGVLTMTDDSQTNADGGKTVITTTLSADVLSGKEGLVISFEFDAWSQAEITDLYFGISVNDIV